MSEYIPISSWQIARTLLREGLVVPRAGTAEFLSEDHERIEAESRALCAALRTTHGISDGLQPQFNAAFEAISTFVALVHDAVWVDVYGETLLRQVCDAIFGRNLRMEILRPRNMRRRVLLSGALGTGRG